MSKRKRLTGLAALATLGALVLALWLLWPPTAITVENAARIRPGMTLPEVEALLGRCAGDYAGPVAVVGAGRCGDPMDARDAACHGPDPSGGSWLSWLSDDALIRVRFDAHGRVAETSSYPVLETGGRFMDRLRRCLGL